MSDPRVHGSRGDCAISVRRGGLASLGEGVRAAVPGARTVLLAVDEGVRTRWAPAAHASLEAAGFRAHVVPLRADESEKSMEAVQRIWTSMLQAGMQRSDALVALGGGIVGDLAGFAAATYLRGVPLVMAPTTLLAMVDAAIGGKTGVNLPLPKGGLGKNLAGAFHAPAWVLCDVDTLATLSDRDFRCGLAECVKHALIADPTLLEWIGASRAAILGREPASLEELVRRSAAIKAAVVSRDEFERGERAHLNLGHTFGHALESLLHERLRHGEAVAIGLVAATAASRAAGWWPDADPAAVAADLAQLGLPTKVPVPVERTALDAAMGFDKKGAGGRRRLVLLRGLGKPGVLEDTSDAVVGAGWAAVGA
jgi:3-dehydroquinate synthase